jgi:hypothetical protein
VIPISFEPTKRIKTVATTVKYFHERDPSTGWGRTWAVVWRGNMRYVGVAEVAAGDQFSRRRGREIAEGRALTCASRPRGVLRFGFSVTDLVPGTKIHTVLIHGGAPRATQLMQYFLATVPPIVWKEKSE